MTFTTKITDEGVILISQLSTDLPFALIKNKEMIFLPIHGNYADYSVRMDPRCVNLDMSRMVLYNAYNIATNGSTHWVIAIPFNGSELMPSNYLPGLSLQMHKVFSKADFPEDFEHYGNLGVVCGFPE
jgi:hypothetical protein